MRILLDAKDLINLIEFNKPFDISALNSWLRQNNGILVLSFTNISDFVGPAFKGGDFLKMRVLLQKIENLPVRYIREGLIIRDELRLALVAFQAGQDPSPLDPYVKRWDETVSWEGDPVTKMLVALRLDEIVWMARSAIQGYKKHAPILKDKLYQERKLSGSERLSLKEIFIRAIPDRLKDRKIYVPGIDLRAFGEWLWRFPSRCLGLRLQFELYHQLLKDKSMAFQDGDISDFTHIGALPYVDQLTVDKRMADLLGKVIKKLRVRDGKADLLSRISKDFNDLLTRLS